MKKFTFKRCQDDVRHIVYVRSVALPNGLNTMVLKLMWEGDDKKVRKRGEDNDGRVSCFSAKYVEKEVNDEDNKKVSNWSKEAKGVERNADGNAIFHLSHKRRGTVKLMNGRPPLVDIREFYEKNDQLSPLSLLPFVGFDKSRAFNL